MQALSFNQHGTLANVALRELTVPTPKADEVLLAVKAAALNRLDLWVLAGWPSLKLHLPHVMGSDGAGEIVAVGEAVMGWNVGDRVAVNPTLYCGNCVFCEIGRNNLCDNFAVIGEHAPGFYAEYAAVPARNLVRLPDHATYEQAAAASLVFVTAWHSLIVRGGLRAGEDVLIVGAGGGVNTAAIQIARLGGARRIFVVGSDDAKLERAAQLGADVLINRNKHNWARAIFKATQQRGVDIVVDNVGAATFRSSMRSLRRGGRLLTVGNTSGPTFEIDNRLIFGKQISLIGSTMGTQADYERVMDFVFAGKLNPVIDTVYPLNEGLTALQRLESGNVQGKLVLVP